MHRNLEALSLCMLAQIQIHTTRIQPSRCNPKHAETHASTPCFLQEEAPQGFTSTITCFRGLTTPQQQKPFRDMHPIKLKRGIAAVRTTAQLPSDADPYHTYGCLPAFRSMEMIRMMGYCSAAHTCSHSPHSRLIHCATIIASEP